MTQQNQPVQRLSDEQRRAFAEEMLFVRKARGLKIVADIEAALQPQTTWFKVSDKMPESGRTVLAYYKNRLGFGRRIRAKWIAAKSQESGSESDMGEYDEEADCYYDPEGWYEQMDNWAEYTAVTVNEGDVTHWMYMPAEPKD